MKIMSNKREQPAAAVYLARIAQVTNIGHQPGFEWQGKIINSSYKIELTYELVNERMEDGRPFWVSEEITNTDSEKGNLRSRVLAAGVTFETFDDILGRAVTVTIEQNEKGYAKIVNVAGVPGGYDVGQLENPAVNFDMYDEQPDLDTFKAFPEFKRNKIESALDFKEQPLYAELLANGYFDEKESEY